MFRKNPLSYPHLGAFESTNIHGSGVDILDTTGHVAKWREDLDRLNAAGIQELRYPVPWHRIERVPGTFDWRWIDGPIRHMQATGMRPILDPLHHVSFPAWLQDGFANPAFPDLYLRFIRKIMERYEWVNRYTIVNEPLPTLVLCGLTANWYPHQSSEMQFVTMAKNVARALCLAAHAMRKLNPAVQLYHIDSCEHHTALDVQSKNWVAHANRRRFLFHDLTLGQIDDEHALLPYLSQYGFTEDDQCWFQDHSSTMDVLGLDYYAHSEINWRWNTTTASPYIDFPCKNPQGFAAVARQYVDRFGLPVMLSETNIGGSVTDRLMWLKYMEQQSEVLAASADFRGFCWFPSLDATDWDTLCTVANRRLSPMGIWSLNQDSGAREASELSEWYVRLARRECKSWDLPEYPLHSPLDEHLIGFRRMMQRVPPSGLVSGHGYCRPCRSAEIELEAELGTRM